MDRSWLVLLLAIAIGEENGDDEKNLETPKSARYSNLCFQLGLAARLTVAILPVTRGIFQHHLGQYIFHLDYLSGHHIFDPSLRDI